MQMQCEGRRRGCHPVGVYDLVMDQKGLAWQVVSIGSDTAKVRETSYWTARTFRGASPPSVSLHPTDEEGRRGRVQGMLRTEVKKVQCKTTVVGTLPCSVLYLKVT